MMILAQVDIEPWHIYTGMIGAVSYVAVRSWTAVSKEKRESKRDEAHTQFLSRVAESTQQTATNVAVMSERISHICKAECSKFQSKQH